MESKNSVQHVSSWILCLHVMAALCSPKALEIPHQRHDQGDAFRPPLNDWRATYGLHMGYLRPRLFRAAHAGQCSNKLDSRGFAHLVRASSCVGLIFCGPSGTAGNEGRIHHRPWLALSWTRVLLILWIQSRWHPPTHARQRKFINAQRTAQDGMCTTSLLPDALLGSTPALAFHRRSPFFSAMCCIPLPPTPALHLSSPFVYRMVHITL